MQRHPRQTNICPCSAAPHRMAMEPVSSWNAVFSMAEKTILNSGGASTQPCLTPFVTWMVSDDPPSSRNLAGIPSRNVLTTAMNFLGMPYLATMVFQSLSRQIISNALVISTNAVKRWRYCSWHFSCSCRAAKKIMSVVLRPFAKPHLLSG